MVNRDTNYYWRSVFRREMRRPSRLSISVTVLFAELIALTLLNRGWSVGLSLGIAVAVGTGYLGFPCLLAMVRLTLRGGARMFRNIAVRITDKRTYRFRLGSLLLAVLLISIVFAFYDHRSRRVHSEQLLLKGRWQMINQDGSSVVLSSGKPIIVEFENDNFTVSPSQNPKWLDFHLPRGAMHAIYRWEGKRLRVMQVSAGLQRPTSFDQKISGISRKPGAKTATDSVTTFLLERVPD